MKISDGGFRMAIGHRLGRWLLVCLLALGASNVALSASSTAYAQSDAEHQQFLFAYKLLQRGEIEEAAKEFDDYLGDFPKGEKVGDAQYYRALLHRKAGDNKKAAALLADAKKPTLVPGYAVDLLNGQVLNDLGQHADALKALEQIKTSELDKKVAAPALYLKGQAYRGAKNLKASAAALSEAALLDTPLKPRALLELAKVRALMKDTDRAIGALNRCLALQDKAVTPEAARFAGDLCYKAGEYKQAIGYYNTVVSKYQTSTHFAPAVVSLLWAQFADKRYDDLLRTYNAAIEALPVLDRLPAYYLAGSAYKEQGKHQDAAAMFDKATAGQARLPIQEKALYKLALCRFELKQYDKMNDAVERMLKAFPKTELKVDVAFMQATAEAEAGQVERGAARLTSFIDAGPTNPYYQQALLRRAHLYETHKEIDAAAGDYEAYLQTVKQPTATSLQADFRLMELLGALGKHDKIITRAQDVLAIQDTKLRTPEVEQEAMYRLAVAYRFKGELDKALAQHARLTTKHRLNPYRAESVLEQGLIRMTQGDPDRGVPLLMDAIAREGLADASKVNALRIVAQYEEDQGETQKAFDLRMKMQQLGNKKVFSATELVWIGNRLIEQGKAKEALGYLADIKDEKVANRALLLTGKAQRMVGDLDKAIKTLKEVRAVSERYAVDAWLQIALVYRDQGKYKEALAELAALQNPDRGRHTVGQAHFEAGGIYRVLHDEAKRKADPVLAKQHAAAGIKAYKRLWVLYPDRKGETLAKRGYLALADFQLATGDEKGEVETLGELMEDSPESIYGTFARGLLAIRADRAEQADRSLRTVVEMAKKTGDTALSERAQKLLRRER